MNMYEAFDYGPIVAMDSEWGLMVTYNASYFNLWVLRGENEWGNTECMHVSDSIRENQDIWQICTRASKWITETIKESIDETDE